MRKSGKKKKEADAIDEVEELLKLTQEDLLLKLTVNSHTKSSSKFGTESSSHTNNAIHPDLDRRFQALRSKPSNPKIEKVDDEDLFARFAALKGTDSTTTTTSIGKNDVEEDDEDEVSKIINWAIDAARLDPSPSSDIDDHEDDDNDNDDETDSSDDDDGSRNVDRKKKVSKK